MSIGKTSLIKSFENAASVSFGKLLKERLPTSTKLVSTRSSGVRINRISQTFSDAVSVSIGKMCLIKSVENAASVSFGKLLKEKASHLDEVSTKL